MGWVRTPRQRRLSFSRHPTLLQTSCTMAPRKKAVSNGRSTSAADSKKAPVKPLKKLSSVTSVRPPLSLSLPNPPSPLLTTICPLSRAQFSYGPSTLASGSRSAAAPPAAGTSRGKGKRKADVVELDSDGDEVIDVDSSDDERPRLSTRVDKGKRKAVEKRSIESAAGTF